jgi:hypothetical protein
MSVVCRVGPFASVVGPASALLRDGQWVHVDALSDAESSQVHMVNSVDGGSELSGCKDAAWAALLQNNITTNITTPSFQKAWLVAGRVVSCRESRVHQYNITTLSFQIAWLVAGRVVSRRESRVHQDNDDGTGLSRTCDCSLHPRSTLEPEVLSPTLPGRFPTFSSVQAVGTRFGRRMGDTTDPIYAIGLPELKQPVLNAITSLTPVPADVILAVELEEGVLRSDVNVGNVLAGSFFGGAILAVLVYVPAAFWIEYFACRRS